MPLMMVHWARVDRPVFGFWGGEHWVEPLPLGVGQFTSVRVSSSPFYLESIARHNQTLLRNPSLALCHLQRHL